MKELTLREIQLLSLEILKEVHAFCEAEGLRYSMAYGSLIGTVRHKGFVPWDDDIDIVMPRPDYERFLRGFRSERFKVSVPGVDSYQPIARVYDTRDTVAYSKYPAKSGERAGLWIDLYPLDNVSDDPAEFHRDAEACRAQYGKVVHMRKSLASLKDLRMLGGSGSHTLRRWVRALVKRLRYSPEKIMEENRKLLKMVEARPWGSTGHIAQLGVRGWEYDDFLPADLFDNNILMPFEDMEVRVPKDCHTFLVPQYPDYMTLPPVEKRVTHDSTKFFWKDK